MEIQDFYEKLMQQFAENNADTNRKFAQFSEEISAIKLA
jgi:hypothetical protein